MTQKKKKVKSDIPSLALEKGFAPTFTPSSITPGRNYKGTIGPKQKGEEGEGAAPLSSSDRRALDSQFGQLIRFNCYLWATRICATIGILRHLVCANPLSYVVVSSSTWVL